MHYQPYKYNNLSFENKTHYRVNNIIMHENNSKHNLVASGVHAVDSSNKKKIELEIILPSNMSCANTEVHDFIKLNKQNTHQCTDFIEQGKISLLIKD